MRDWECVTEEEIHVCGWLKRTSNIGTCCVIWSYLVVEFALRDQLHAQCWQLQRRLSCSDFLLWDRKPLCPSILNLTPHGSHAPIQHHVLSLFTFTFFGAMYALEKQDNFSTSFVRPCLTHVIHCRNTNTVCMRKPFEFVVSGLKWKACKGGGVLIRGFLVHNRNPIFYLLII